MGGKTSAIRKGPRPPTRAEALLKMLKANNYPAHQLGSLENTVVNQDVKPIEKDDFQEEMSKYSRRLELLLHVAAGLDQILSNCIKSFLAL